MKKEFSFIVVLLLNHFFVSAQGNNSTYKNGYALKGKDTIYCKVLFESKYNEARKSVKVLINDDEATFFAGGSITGFGIEEEGIKQDYGAVDVEILVGRERRVNVMYVKKIVAGVINLYEYSYNTTTTKRTTINGVEQPGSVTTTQTYTNYYIAKTDSTKPILATPVILPGYRKKDLESYLSDNAVLFAREEKKYSLKELIATIKEYNAAYIKRD